MSETSREKIQRTPDNYLAPPEVEQIAKLEAQLKEMQIRPTFDRETERQIKEKITELKASLADKLEDLKPRGDASA